MRTRFADAAQHADAYFVIRAIFTLHTVNREDYEDPTKSARVTIYEVRDVPFRVIAVRFIDDHLVY